MLALQVIDVKEFMNLLLTTDTFDGYLLEEALLVREYTFSLDGRLSEGYYSEEEREAQGLTGCRFLPYAKFRPLLLEQIKGKRAPRRMKLVLAVPPHLLPEVSFGNTEAVDEFLLQILYDENGLFLRSGISYRTFSTDRSAEKQWEEEVLAFFKDHGICTEQLI